MTEVHITRDTVEYLADHDRPVYFAGGEYVITAIYDDADCVDIASNDEAHEAVPFEQLSLGTYKKRKKVLRQPSPSKKQTKSTPSLKNGYPLSSVRPYRRWKGMYVVNKGGPYDGELAYVIEGGRSNATIMLMRGTLAKVDASVLYQVDDDTVRDLWVEPKPPAQLGIVVKYKGKPHVVIALRDNNTKVNIAQIDPGNRGTVKYWRSVPWDLVTPYKDIKIEEWSM